MCILSSISSYCDSQIDGLCPGFAVVDYIFEAIFIITILICINISISASSSILQSSQYNSATIRIYINKASFIALMWTFIIYILRPTFVAIIGVVAEEGAHGVENRPFMEVPGLGGRCE